MLILISHHLMNYIDIIDNKELFIYTSVYIEDYSHMYQQI